MPSQIIQDCTNLDEENICVLSGPSHAEEVSCNIPTTIVVAGPNMTLNRKIQKLLSSTNLRAYSNSDLLGVELAGAIKNVISIASGICIGLGFGDNTTAALITRGINEIARLGKTLGAEESTFYGLAGIGDLSVQHLASIVGIGTLVLKLEKGSQLIEIIKEADTTVEGFLLRSTSLYFY